MIIHTVLGGQRSSWKIVVFKISYRLFTTALWESAFPSPKQNSHCNKHECSEKYKHMQTTDVTYGHEKRLMKK